MNEVRLNKALAAAGVCSRRAADELIASGAVALNGQTVTELGVRVTPGRDRVTVKGKAVELADPEQAEFTYILLHKPVQVVTTVYDPEGRRTVMDFMPQHLKAKRLYPVGRLDFFSEGLLLLTDDGELTHRLTHPRRHIPKHYQVTLREMPTKGMMQTMRQGMTLREGEKLAPMEASLLSQNPVVVELVLHQGLNRQIRRVCRDFNLTILSLVRTQIGPIHLGELPAGQCRPLSEKELRELRKAVGM